jgi:flagellar hook-associated protein 3 FlgL
MTIINAGVSFLGQFDSQSRLLVGMRVQMDDLSRQIGTKKKFDTLGAFGLDTQRILQLHAGTDQLQTYSSNIDSANANMKLMSDSMTKITDNLNKMVSFLQSQPQDAQFDASAVGTQASQMIDFITDIANINLGGRYLFAGTDAQNPPVADREGLKANFAAQVNNWLSGGIPTNTLLSNTDAFSGTTLGLSATVSSAQNVNVQIDKNLEISYGAVADRSGIQDALRALGFMANLRAPDPATDVPNNAQFATVIDHVLAVARKAIDDIQVAQGKMSGSLDLSSSIQDEHKQDINILSGQLSDAEDADPAEAISRLQALQTQLNASYEVTRIISQLTLTNFLT